MNAYKMALRTIPVSKSDPWGGPLRTLRGLYPSHTLIRKLRSSHTLNNKLRPSRTLTRKKRKKLNSYPPPPPNPSPDPRVSGAVQALAHPHSLGALPGETQPSALTTRSREIDGCVGLVVAVSSHKSAMFLGGGGCNFVVRWPD